ncbi:cysteine proteinase [Teratosphaeria nubilosa]|uniref:ubiquitinyl hydrolase 1 n=1 Tax=Teratosphaeria nubilosa TaxID=161662 RepID=A0A6G1KTK3_9PEZI|nr:cysteine proteinase [Teratosphaeria nubilosa]
MSEEEQAQFQELSNKYEPEVTGPLVGQRETSTNITVEYAAADPVYQAKTANLPQKYSHYRTVRGDGRCGWRAIGFGYLETLIHFGDSGKFLEEEVRLKSLTNVLIAAGYSQDLFEDFADETYELLRKVGAALQTGSAETVLHEAFNDETVQNYIITHLRLLTAAWMKTRPGDYAPWLIGQTVEQFCENHVMPIAAEIDNVSLIALKDVLLSPAGFALEVLYLDRTDGSEVNMHRFDPVGLPVTIGTICLLYRPGHYDILYKTEDIPQSINPVTYLHYSTSHHYEPIQDLGVSDFMTMIPGMSYASPSSGWIQLSGPFRPSIWELEPDFMHATSQSLPFQTSIFKNSQ